MTKQTLFSTTLLLGLFTFIFSSCGSDDPVAAKPTIALTEVGAENSKTGVAGHDLHLEGNITAEGLIKSISVTIKSDAKDMSTLNIVYNSGKYIGVKNAEFHEHIDIPADFKAGDYKLTMTVTDNFGQTTEAASDVKIAVAAEGAPEVTLTSVGEGNSQKAVAGGKLPVSADIKAPKKIAEIEVELHKEGTDYERVFTFKEAYQGLTESKFNEIIMVPADSPAGEYHLHFTVTDAEGNSTTAECEGLVISSK
jgi:hypothetical protein